MLTTRHALSSVRPSFAVNVYLCKRPCRRTFVSTTIHSISEGFLDLAIALPYPPSFPSYSTTIILVTVATRLFFTVPFSIWAKQRQWRAEHVVVPQLQQEMRSIHQKVRQEMVKEQFRGSKEELIAELTKRSQGIAASRKKELLSQYHCSPIPTLVLPVISQLPLFVGTSMVIAEASRAPSVFDSESFLTLTSLAHSDPTVTLPIVLGLITLANVETSRWFVSAQVLEREQKVAQWTAERRARGEQVMEPRKIYQSSLRILSVGRILIAAMVPGSVQIYWVTSATFGLVQSWILDLLDARKRKLVSLETASASPPKTSSARK